MSLEITITLCQKKKKKKNAQMKISIHTCQTMAQRENKPGPTSNSFLFV